MFTKGMRVVCVGSVLKYLSSADQKTFWGMFPGAVLPEVGEVYTVAGVHTTILLKETCLSLVEVKSVLIPETGNFMAWLARYFRPVRTIERSQEAKDIRSTAVPHVNCRCTATPYFKDEADAQDAVNRWLQK